MSRRATGENDRAVLAYGRVHPERPRRIGVAKVDLFRWALERLDPNGRSGAVVATEEKRFAIGHPDGALDIAIERACEISSFAAGGGSDKDLVLIVRIPVAREPIGNLQPVGRKEAENFERSAFRQLADFAALNVQYLDDGLIGIAEVRVGLASKSNLLAVGRPGKRGGGRRRRRAL